MQACTASTGKECPVGPAHMGKAAPLAMQKSAHAPDLAAAPRVRCHAALEIVHPMKLKLLAQTMTSIHSVSSMPSSKGLQQLGTAVAEMCHAPGKRSGRASAAPCQPRGCAFGSLLAGAARRRRACGSCSWMRSLMGCTRSALSCMNGMPGQHHAHGCRACADERRQGMLAGDLAARMAGGLGRASAVPREQHINGKFLVRTVS